MPLRPSLLSRWLSPAELLQKSTLRTAHIPSPRFIHPSLSPLRSQATVKSTRRSLTTAANYIGRPAARSRPNLRSIQLPKQRLNRRYNSGSSTSSQTEKEGTSLSQRLRKLSREYGWAAVGVYFGLSALDFPFCFAAVRLLGVERIGYFEHVVVQSAKDFFHSIWPQTEPTAQSEGEDTQNSLVLAEERNQEEASIWTQLALAYAIHKSFIFIRVPLTAAVTPKIVKTLRRWGWDIGKRTPKSP